MARIVVAFALVVIFFASSAVGAVEPRPIRIGVAPAPAPYVLSEADGLFADIANEIAQRLGRAAEITSLAQGDSDPFTLDPELDLAFAWPRRHRPDHRFAHLLDFDFVAVTMKEGAFDLRRAEDVLGKRVVALAEADRWLMEPFRTLRERVLLDDNAYLEIDDPAVQAQLLLEGFIDVALMERQVATHFLADAAERVVYHDLFPIDHAVWVVARDPGLGDAAARRLRAMRAEGFFDDLAEKWGRPPAGEGGLIGDQKDVAPPPSLRSQPRYVADPVAQAPAP